MISKMSRKSRKAFAKWIFFTFYGLGQTPQYHLSSCGTIFIHQRGSKLQLMALNRSPTLLIDHRCSHPTRQFFNYNHIAHDCEGSWHYTVTRGVGRQTAQSPPCFSAAPSCVSDMMAELWFLWPRLSQREDDQWEWSDSSVLCQTPF